MMTIQVTKAALVSLLLYPAPSHWNCQFANSDMGTGFTNHASAIGQIHRGVTWSDA